jgi:hypothetical protein
MKITPQNIGIITLGLAALVLTLIAGLIIWMMFKGTAQSRIANFLFEAGGEGQVGKPSVSRLQMLIWNFVVAFAFLYVLANQLENLSEAMKALFQPEILVLLGISNGTYLLGKRTKQGSAMPQPEIPETTKASGGQPVTSREISVGGPGPQGTQ